LSYGIRITTLCRKVGYSSKWNPNHGSLARRSYRPLPSQGSGLRLKAAPKPTRTTREHVGKSIRTSLTVSRRLASRFESVWESHRVASSKGSRLRTRSVSSRAFGSKCCFRVLRTTAHKSQRAHASFTLTQRNARRSAGQPSVLRDGDFIGLASGSTAAHEAWVKRIWTRNKLFSQEPAQAFCRNCTIRLRTLRARSATSPHPSISRLIAPSPWAA
jgi:hypothetical protein